MGYIVPFNVVENDAWVENRLYLPAICAIIEHIGVRGRFCMGASRTYKLGDRVYVYRFKKSLEDTNKKMIGTITCLEVFHGEDLFGEELEDTIITITLYSGKKIKILMNDGFDSLCFFRLKFKSISELNVNYSS